MRQSLWAIAGVCMVVGLGCSAHSPSTPAPAPATPPDLSASALDSASLLGQSLGTHALTQSAFARFDVAVDLTTLEATVIPVKSRQAQQSELYNLSIEEFITGDNLKIVDIDLTPNTLDITYHAVHPFPTPADLAGPPNAFSNRADLSVTGRVLWLLDDPDPAIYFQGTDDVVVNTRLITNPDGYFTPGQLIGSPGTTANTFPFQLLVDETRDNRIGLSNGGTPTGNYNAGAGGWQVPEITAGPTGFGLWAQGQTSENTIALDRALLEGSASFNASAVIVVKYEDPRGGTTPPEKRSNRLPDGDPLGFAYRMPHAALDVEKIDVVSAGAGFESGSATSATVGVRVRDWDARAAEATSTNLSGESNVALVSAGESGVPTVDLDIPDIAGTNGDALAIDDNDPGGDAAPDSGQPGDELYYTGTIDGTPANSGFVTGLLRAVDPTDVTPPADWDLNRFNLLPTLVPIAGDTSEGTSYMSFTIQVVGPTGQFDLVVNPIQDGSHTWVMVHDVTIPNDNPFDLSIDWDDGAGFVTVDTNLDPLAATQFGPYDSPDYTLGGASPETRAIQVRLEDTGGSAVGLASGDGTLSIEPVPTPPPGTEVFNANFTNGSGDNAWVEGQDVSPVLPNTDLLDWSYFSVQCQADDPWFATHITACTGGFAHTGPDTGALGCDGEDPSYNGDYGDELDNNIVTPLMNLSAYSADATLVFNDHRAANDTAQFKVSYATTPGTWVEFYADSLDVTTPSSDTVVIPGSNFVNRVVALPAAVLGQASVRLRFQLTDTAGWPEACCRDVTAGWAIDDVRVIAN